MIKDQSVNNEWKQHNRVREMQCKCRAEKEQSARVCLCIYVCMRVCVFACACQWLGGMKGIPCSLLRRRKDFEGEVHILGCLGVTVKAREKRRNTLYTTSTFHLKWEYVLLFNMPLFHGYVKPVFNVGKASNKNKWQTLCLSPSLCVFVSGGVGVRMCVWVSEWKSHQQWNVFPLCPDFLSFLFAETQRWLYLIC